MKILLSFILFAGSVMAQDQSPFAAASACGSTPTNFDVKGDESQHTVAQPRPGKALIYFIQDIGVVSCLGSCLITKIGVDGSWVGANRHNSYFSVSVDPGEHHVCANPQSRGSQSRQFVALAHLTAEAGKIYYFRTRTSGDKYQSLFDLDPIDSDEAKYLIASYPLSIWRPKP